MNSQIWFQLVDFDGKPYKRTTVAKVTLLCSADVDDLRNAVKAQCPNTLASVDAGILLVYENKMAFNQRNALSPFLALESVFREPGFNRGDSPLIILVPPIYPEPLSTSVSVFNEIDQYIDLHNTEEVNTNLRVVKGTFRETTNDSLRKYRNYAETLKNDSCVDEVCKALISITSEDFPDSGFSDSPFVFLAGSSGTGKSQMGFTIEASMRSYRRVYYFLFVRLGPASQHIYLNFQHISKLFTRCCNADGRLYNADASSPTSDSLFRANLYVFGFLYELLSNNNYCDDVKISARTGSEVRDLMIQLGIHQSRPVFILDECIAISDESLRKVRFVRNCFRCLGLGLVMLGTDSTAARLPLSIGSSSRGADPRPWCYVVGQFPSLKLSLIASNLPEWLTNMLSKSRPFFAELTAAKWAEGIQDFDNLMTAVFTYLVQVKKIFGNHYGRLGQLRLFQNAHCLMNNRVDVSTPLIHSHFAQLHGVPKNFSLMNDGCIKNHDDVWIPRSSFPKVEDDVLLYLLLMGGRHHPAFRLDGQPVPYSHFLMKVLTDDRSHILDFSSAARKSTDGMFLESLLSSTVCLASHSNGIGGISLNQFLMNLVYQLQMENVEAGAVTIAGLEKLNGLLQFTIPFLSPENQKWPDTLLQIPGANLGYLERPQNEDKVDLKTNCGIFGESTDYERKMTIKTLRQILRRVPEQATVELVFTRDLQESYFTRSSKSFEDEFQGSHLLNMVFYKIDTSSPSTSLEPIQGLPSANPNARRAVIFFLINGSLSMKP